MNHALKLNPADSSSNWSIRTNCVINFNFSKHKPHNTNCKYLQTINQLIAEEILSQPANDNTNIIKIATRTLGTITDILGAGSNLRITYIDPSNRFVKFFPWLCMLLTLLMLASFRPLGPPQMPLSPLRGPLPILVRGEFNLAPLWGEAIRLALQGRDRPLLSKGRERVFYALLTATPNTSAIHSGITYVPQLSRFIQPDYPRPLEQLHFTRSPPKLPLLAYTAVHSEIPLWLYAGLADFSCLCTGNSPIRSSHF